MSVAGPALESLILNGEPVWEAVDFEIACPRCGYNLRMLTRSRCPECGLEFEWPLVLDQAARRSDFLFEHHWRTRPVRSWLNTLRRSFRPFRFWRSVSIHERVHLGPLWILILISILTFSLTLHGAAWLLSEALAALDRMNATSLGPSAYYEVSVAVAELATMPLKAGWDYLYLPGTVALTLLSALALLSSLRQTLGRCRVRPRQMVRVAAYMSQPVSIYLALFTLGVYVCVVTLQPDHDSAVEIAFIVCNLVIPPLVLGIFLTSGLRNYLRLPRPFLLGLTAAGVAFLFTLTSIVLSNLVARGGL